MYQELALQIAKKAHAGQVDKAGKDYILHPMTVTSYMDTDTEKAVAYLHDIRRYRYYSRATKKL